MLGQAFILEHVHQGGLPGIVKPLQALSGSKLKNRTRTANRDYLQASYARQVVQQ